MTINALIELFEEALEKESFMIRLYESVINKIKDKKVIKVLTNINEDEKEHVNNVNRVLELLKE